MGYNKEDLISLNNVLHPTHYHMIQAFKIFQLSQLK